MNASARLSCAGALCCALLAASGVAHARELPALSARVNDYAHVLSPERAAALESRLAGHEQKTGQQFALLTVPSLDGDDLEGYSIAVAEQWKLGDKKRDDGLIVVLALKEHKVRIEVGYGLEGVIPDAIASRVINEVMAPVFRQNDYAGGLEAGFAVLMHQAGGDGSAAAQPPPQRKPERLGIMLVPLLLFFLISFITGGGRGGGGRGVRMMGAAFGAGMSGLGGYRGGGGGGWGGGGGGGGFSGGGGGFGGGGASGSW